MTAISITLGYADSLNFSTVEKGNASADGNQTAYFTLNYPMTSAPYAGEMMSYVPMRTGPITTTTGTTGRCGPTTTTAGTPSEHGDSGKQQDYSLLGYGALIGIGFSVSSCIDSIFNPLVKI